MKGVQHLGWRILAIEHTPDNLRILKDLLESAGYEFLGAADGLAGLAIAARENPHLILLDIHLPGTDGHQVARRLKADPDLQHIPIIAVSSYGLSGDEATSHAAGCAGYISKPFSPRQLLSMVGQFLPGKPAR